MSISQNNIDHFHMHVVVSVGPMTTQSFLAMDQILCISPNQPLSMISIFSVIDPTVISSHIQCSTYFSCARFMFSSLFAHVRISPCFRSSVWEFAVGSVDRLPFTVWIVSKPVALLNCFMRLDMHWEL